MADVYRGLTIRIGADTQPLTRALSTVNSALSRVQSSIRLVQKGLKLDPANLTATQQGIGLVSERTELLSQKLIQLRNSFDQAKQKTPWLTNAATGMEHLAANTEQATSVLNRINQELEEFKNTYNKMASDNSLNVSDDFRTTLRTLENAGLIQHDVIENYNRMAAAQVKWNDQLNRMERAEQFRRMAQEMEQLKAEIKAAAQEYANLFGKMAYEHITGLDGNEIVRSKAALESLSGVQSQILSHAEKLREAWQLDPSDVQVASAATREFAENVAVAERKLAEAKRELSELNAAGIEDSKQSFMELSMSVDNANGKLREAKQAEMMLEAEMKDIIRQIEHIKALENSADYAEKLAALEGRLEAVEGDLKDARKATGDWEREYKRLQQQMAKKNAERAVEELTADVKKAKNAQTQWNATVDTTRSKFAALRDLGTTFANTVSPLATAALYRTVSAADELDAAYRDMRKTVDGTEEQFRDLKQAAIDFSKTSIVSAADILEIEAMAGQLGIAVENLETFATVASNLDIATDIESEEIAKSMGQLANIMHWNQNIVDGTRSDYERFSDSLVRLGNNFAAQESAIMKITTRIAPMGALIDISTDKVLAWSTALAATGQGSEAAGTALARTMSQIEGAVAEGGKSLDKFAKVAQMSSKEFAALWDKDASAAMQRFIWGLKDIDEKGGSVDATLQDMGITAVRQKQALEGLVNTYDVLDEALDMSAAAWTLGGDAAEEARKKSEGFSGSYHMLLNNGKALASVIGEGLVPFLNTASAAASFLSDILTKLGKGGQFVTSAFLGIVAASGPVFRFWGQTQLYLDASAKNMARTGKEANKLSKAWRNMGKGAKFGAGALSALAMVIVGVVVAALSQAIEYSRNYEKATDGLLDTVGLGQKEFKKYGKSLKDIFKATNRIDMGRLVKESAEFVDSIKETRREAGKQIYLLEDYRKTISKVGKDGSIAAGDVVDMRNAVDGLNSILGTNYEVSGNAADGYYLMRDGAKVAKDEIYELIDAMETQISMSMYEETWEGLKKRSKDYADSVEEANENWAKAQRDAENATTKEDKEAAEGQKKYWEEETKRRQKLLDDNEEAIEQTKRQMGIVTEAQQDSASSFTKFLANNESVNEALAANGQSAEDFGKALEKAGISEEEFSKLSDYQMANLAKSFNGHMESLTWAVDENTGEIVAGFDDMYVEIGQYSKNAGKQIPKWLQQGIAGGIGALKSALGPIQGGVTAALSGLGPTGQLAGKNLLLGLSNGVHDATIIAQITTHIKSIANQILQSFMKGLVEKSPSKATEQMGAYLLEGLAIGIDENAQLAYKAAQSASDLALAGFGAITAGEMAVNANNASSMVLNVSFNGVTINDNAAIESQTLELVMALQQLWRTKVGA